MDSEKIIAVIPARAGSKRLPRKNILPLAGRPCIEWTLEAVSESTEVSRVAVSTDDPTVQELASHYADVEIVDRPELLGRDEASTVDVMLHALEVLKAQDSQFSWLLLLQPTSPLRTSVHIEFPTLEGMAFSNKFVTRSIRYSGTETEYFSNLERFGQFLRKLDSLEENITLLTMTEDAFLPTVFRSQNAHPITVWWHWIHKSYPNHQTRVKEFIATNRPLIEVKKDRWGWEPASWADPQSPQRISLGFSDYVLLFESDYSDSGISQILAPPEFFSEYKARLGQFQ